MELCLSYHFRERYTGSLREKELAMSGVWTSHIIRPRRVSLTRVLVSRTRGKIVADGNVREDYAQQRVCDFWK